MLNFNKHLSNICIKKNNRLCIGLDVDNRKLHNTSISYMEGFIKDIIDATINICPVYKVNLAFYERLGKYGFDLLSVNPITFKSDSLWSNKKSHLGVLLPNKKIIFKKSLTACNELGLLWVKLPNNVFLNKYKSNSYHKADFNLFWINIRENLEYRLSVAFE